MGNALSSLQDQYFFLTTNLDAMLDACQTQAQKDAIVAAYVDSRRHYWDCINQIFHDDDPNVVAAVNQMAAAKQTLEQSLQHLNDIAKVMNAVATAVKIGGEPAALAG
jgi:hypothetical protein